MNYKAVEVNWIFLLDGHTDTRTEVFQEVLADLKKTVNSGENIPTSPDPHPPCGIFVGPLSVRPRRGKILVVVLVVVLVIIGTS